ncbi:MAG TPA: hypothetical protein VE129_12900, partial [Thermoanaerobaculia bacterium]|nr:hypothetical protein [Thermoanaerobaculia bacterium]
MNELDARWQGGPGGRAELSPPGEQAVALPLAAASPRRDRRDSLQARLALVAEVVRGGLLELWAHKLRSVLTLTLLMLGVFTLVVLTSVIDGVIDKVRTGFSGLAWD